MSENIVERDSDPKDEWPTGLINLLVDKQAEGISLAIILFTQNNRISMKPTKDCENPLEDAMLMITAELAIGNSSYPFGEDSLNQELEYVIQEYGEAIEFLWKDGSKEIDKFIVTIICGQCLEFFQRHKKEIEEMMQFIRNPK